MALGHAVVAYTRLQENLSHLFSAVLYDGEVSDIALAAWHANTSDQAQRDMLKAAAEKALATRPGLVKDITDLANRASSAADDRNRFVHTAYATLNSESMIPDDYYGNKRSRQISQTLGGTSLLEEMHMFRAKLSALTTEAAELFQRLVDPERAPLRDRPPEPVRQDRGSPSPQSRQSRKEARVRQQQSSQRKPRGQPSKPTGDAEP